MTLSVKKRKKLSNYVLTKGCIIDGKISPILPNVIADWDGTSIATSFRL